MLEKFRLSEITGRFSRKQRSADERFVVFSDVTVEVRDKFGNLKSRSEQHNLRTTVGIDFWDSQLFKVGTAAATANFIALTTDATAPAAGDSTLTSELTTNGLARAQASDAHTSGTAQSVLSHTWTYTGSTSVVIAKAGLFNAASLGSMVLETLLSSTATVSANGDTVTVSWTINY